MDINEDITPEDDGQTTDPLEGFDRGEGDPLLGEDPFETEQQVQQPAQEETPAESPSVFEIDGEQITLDQLKEWKENGLRQADYTRKTQEVAEMRKQIETNAGQFTLNAIMSQPIEQRRALVEEFARANGMSVVEGTASPMQAQGAPTVPWDELSDEGKMLYAQNAQLMAQLQSIAPVLKETSGYISTVKEQQQRQVMVQQASASIKQATGADVSAGDFDAAMQATGLNDPEAAWWKVNGAKVAQGAFQAGRTQAKPKPNTPDSGGKTFDPYEKDSKGNYVYPNEVAINRMVAQGYRPTRLNPPEDW